VERSILNCFCSEEAPVTVRFPPCGENCALTGASSLFARIRWALGGGRREPIDQKPILTAYHIYEKTDREEVGLSFHFDFIKIFYD